MCISTLVLYTMYVFEWGLAKIFYLSFFKDWSTQNESNINIDWHGITTIAITFIIDKRINNYRMGQNSGTRYEIFLAQ